MDTMGKKLGLKEKMAYGCGDAASNIIWASTGTFLMFYYTDVVNINAATIGVIFLIAMGDQRSCCTSYRMADR